MEAIADYNNAEYIEAAEDTFRYIDASKFTLNPFEAAANAIVRGEIDLKYWNLDNTKGTHFIITTNGENKQAMKNITNAEALEKASTEAKPAAFAASFEAEKAQAAAEEAQAVANATREAAIEAIAVASAANAEYRDAVNKYNAAKRTLDNISLSNADNAIEAAQNVLAQAEARLDSTKKPADDANAAAQDAAAKAKAAADEARRIADSFKPSPVIPTPEEPAEQPKPIVRKAPVTEEIIDEVVEVEEVIEDKGAGKEETTGTAEIEELITPEAVVEKSCTFPWWILLVILAVATYIYYKNKKDKEVAA